MDQSFGKLSLVDLGFLLHEESALQLVLHLLSSDLCFEVVYHVEPSQQVLLKVALYHVWEGSRLRLTLIKRILYKRCELLLVVRRVVHRPRTSAFLEGSASSFHIPRTVARLGFLLLQVLFLEVSVLSIVELIGTRLIRGDEVVTVTLVRTSVHRTDVDDLVRLLLRVAKDALVLLQPTRWLKWTSLRRLGGVVLG